MKKLLTFTASWCGPCKMLKPILAKLAEEGKINWENYDIDEQRAYADQMGVRSVPALYFFDENGSNTEITTGFIPQDKILKFYGYKDGDEVAAPVVEEVVVEPVLEVAEEKIEEIVVEEVVVEENIIADETAILEEEIILDDVVIVIDGVEYEMVEHDAPAEILDGPIELDGAAHEEVIVDTLGEDLEVNILESDEEDFAKKFLEAAKEE